MGDDPLDLSVALPQPVAGVDEAGRGPLAGPVTAAAVVLATERPIDGLTDSKRLSASARLRLEAAIKTQAAAWAVGWATVDEIDRLNVLQAALLAMQRAVEGLMAPPAAVLIDGNRCPVLSCPTQAVVGGDRRVAVIGAASILAKVARDREMERLDQHYPGYGLARHKGYGTAAHRRALAQLGPTPIHRRSFAPVREALAARQTGDVG